MGVITVVKLAQRRGVSLGLVGILAILSIAAPVKVSLNNRELYLS